MIHYYLELAVWLLLAYGLGCVAGAVLRGALRR